MNTTIKFHNYRDLLLGGIVEESLTATRISMHTSSACITFNISRVSGMT